MRNFKITWLGLIPLSLAMLPQARAAEAVAPEQWLLEQVRIGEAGNKEELVRQSLYRLEMMDPNNPEVIAARMRLALRQGNQALAQQQLDKLKRLAPQSGAYRQAEMNMLLTQPETRQKLQQARLMATAGRLPEAKAQYDALFRGEPPTLDLAVEYWRLVARLPGQEAKALKQLQALDQQYSGNVALRMSLARMLFSQDRDAQAYDLLQKIAADPAGRGDAADLWLDKVKAMPVSPQSVAALNRFLGVFYTGDRATDAREELARQQKLLADPAYQARVRGLAQVDKGGSRAAIPALKKALAAAPNDGEVLGALGQAYSRAGNRPQALKLYRQALEADKDGYSSGKWRSLIKSTGYWLAIDEGDKALQAGNLALARQKYQQARQIDGTDGDALIGLGDVAVASNDDAAAEGFYRQALRRDPGNGSALRGLVNIYQRQSPEKALAYLNGLPRSQQNKLRSTLDGLQLDMLKRQAEALAEQRQWHQAAEKYRRAQQRDPDDVWLTYRYAQTLRQAGQPQQADALFRRLAQRQRANPQQAYAYALYLSGSDRDPQALAQLHTLPAAQWNDNMRELAQRLKMQATLEHAERLRAAGDEPAAVAYLRRQPADTRIDLLLADWALARGEYAAALADYQRVRQREPNNPDARLGEVEAYVAQGRLSEARRRLQTEPPQQARTINTERRVANAWSAVGEPQRASAIFQRLKTAAAREPAGQAKALVYRDAARLERDRRQPAPAQQDYRQAMVASGITPSLPQDNDGYTYLTRNHPGDDWLKRGIRSDAADLYRQQDVNVTLDHDYWRSSGSGGISDYHAHDTMLQVDMPLYDGRAFFRTDTVRLDAGSFSDDGSGRYYETFGTCDTRGCSGDEQQKTTGTSVAAGWKNDRWAGDIGTTPMGFEVVDWTGGLAYSGDWRHIGWTLAASRRPISSSLLAFGGAKDPNTGTTWGGVRATGVSLSGSYDRGEAHGVWADLSAHRITGKNVADNQRERLMAGYYYKLINEDNRRVTVGLNSMLWHYQKDLSGYSLGQGGYYSPQQYMSLSLPVNYRQRTENWSWELGGSVSLSHSKTDSQRRYPLQGLIPDSLPDKFAVEDGGSSTGVGYTLRAIVERRLGAHWTLGAGIDIQQAKDYTPSHALIYLRYSLAGWQGDLDLPPQPLTPYADFK
ncbi:cellulose synthase complex outer membrane protein BcsC [Serratia ficaria]|uniref:Cellulose synthase operon protein C n=1 Tax=Serratia ficaria TaxID=61651 RepID=A0A240AAJ9_SERFI|nr:cellulose synthase complex outer membrane protein BcsC [Serratia ficaria]REF42665.1 tetratricopeptide repeat protein [Serratia ficaria]CAI1067062.1 Cellulose synthase operon protein C precursor [Serratia ficaria]CAI1093133.1 Cellulose synthase operon protein C precursor [Serratia ficaria]CAI1095649.1 Cellulose synthase operon protein C precursor [Serratia ficaria]CAI2075089.1 Cellulose synthase operon protein C precursor [Serratia ficaria]